MNKTIIITNTTLDEYVNYLMSKKSKPKPRKDIILKIDLEYRYTNQRKANAFANKFKKLAKDARCKINIKFIKV